ncbi:hypothetical protein ES708_13863 [subsurface metagenome]
MKIQIEPEKFNCSYINGVSETLQNRRKALVNRLYNCLIIIISIVFVLLLSMCGTHNSEKNDDTVNIPTSLDSSEFWQALHFPMKYQTRQDMLDLIENIPGHAEKGINMIFVLINYNFEYRSHPELTATENPITWEDARKLAKTCRDHYIRLIPQYQFIGHQSLRDKNKKLVPEIFITQYPEFNTAPGYIPPYFYEWDPFNDAAYMLAFELMDELVEAFETDAIHVGLDEIMLIGDEHSPSTRDRNPGEVFAHAINKLHRHIVKERGLEMFMWGDRLIDGSKMDFGIWQSDFTGIHTAVDKIPTDIIICPWHYLYRETYPSVPMFLKKGFKVLPASNPSRDGDPKAAISLIRYSMEQNHPNMIGHIFTTFRIKPHQVLNDTAYIKGIDALMEYEKAHH